MAKKLSFLEAYATLIGTVIGAGILAIPYAISKTGFIIGLLIMLFVGLFSVLRLLMIAEVSLRTKDIHQIPGYIGQYLGPRWKKISFWVLIFSGYGSLLAYMIGQGIVLQALMGGNSIMWSLIFFAATSLLIYGGLIVIKKTELILTGAIFFVMVIIGFFAWDSFTFKHFFLIEPDNWVVPYGVLLFAFSGSIAIPEIREELKGREHDMKKAIVRAFWTIFFIYLIFTVFVLGASGLNVTEIATVGLGNALGRYMVIIGNALAFLTMWTSFLTIGYGLMGSFKYDIGLSQNKAWLATVVVPLLLFLVGTRSFISIITLVGGVLVGVQTLAIVLSFWKAKVYGNREPEFDLGLTPVLGAGLIIVSVIGAALTVFSIM